MMLPGGNTKVRSLAGKLDMAACRKNYRQAQPATLATKPAKLPASAVVKILFLNSSHRFFN